MKVITTTPKDFHIHIKRTFDKEVPNWALNAHRGIHFQVQDEMINRTPVGNPDRWAPESLPAPPGYVGGRARSNWQSSVLVPKGGEPNGPNAQSYPGAGDTKALNRQGIASLKPYSRSFSTNNTPYIVALNNRPNPNTGGGWSSQAPLFWMEAALDVVAAQFAVGGK